MVGPDHEPKLGDLRSSGEEERIKRRIDGRATRKQRGMVRRSLTKMAVATIGDDPSDCGHERSNLPPRGGMKDRCTVKASL